MSEGVIIASTTAGTLAGMGVMLLLMNKSLDSFKKQVSERLNQFEDRLRIFEDRLRTVETGMARIEGALFHGEAARREIDR